MTSLRSVWLRRVIVAVALLVGAAVPARADIVLDDFVSPNPGTVYSGSTSFSPTTLGNGWDRSANVTLLSGSSVSGVLGTDTRTSPGLGSVFELSTPAASTAFARVDYSLTGGGSVNWSATGANATGISTTFTFADLSVPYSIVLTDASNNTLTYTGTVTGAGTYTAAIGDFVGTGDLASLTGISIYLNKNVITDSSTTSADFVLDNVSVPTSNAVPAPPAAFLALAALPVFGFYRRKKQPAAA